MTRLSYANFKYSDQSARMRRLDMTSLRGCADCSGPSLSKDYFPMARPTYKYELYVIYDQQSPWSDSANAHWQISQYPVMQPTILRAKITDEYRLTWAVVVRIHMYVIGLFSMIRIINEKKTSLNEQHRTRSACTAALFHPSSLLGGELYNIQLLCSATDD